MDDYGALGSPQESMIEQFTRVLRVLAVVIGIVAIVIGLVFAVKIFTLVHGGLQNPQKFQGVLQRWAPAVGGDELTIETETARVPLANVVAVVVLGGGTLLLGYLALGIMRTGAKIVAWTATDREAVKKLLTYAFGPRGKPHSVE